MAGFNAAAVVEALDYTFEPYAPGCTGSVREPDDKQIADYMAATRQMVNDFRGRLPDELIGGATTITSVLDGVENLDVTVMAEFTGAMAEVAAALCSGTPSKEDILKLPPRRRAHFYAWLQREVMSPEAAPGGGKSQVKNLRSVAAG
jgi:hypothetical protein